MTWTPETVNCADAVYATIAVDNVEDGVYQNSAVIAKVRESEMIGWTDVPSQSSEINGHVPAPAQSGENDGNVYENFKNKKLCNSITVFDYTTDYVLV